MQNDVNQVKLEQPYSVISMRPGDNIDPNKLGSWERPSQ